MGFTPSRPLRGRAIPTIPGVTPHARFSLPSRHAPRGRCEAGRAGNPTAPGTSRGPSRGPRRRWRPLVGRGRAGAAHRPRGAPRLDTRAGRRAQRPTRATPGPRALACPAPTTRGAQRRGRGRGPRRPPLRHAPLGPRRRGRRPAPLAPWAAPPPRAPAWPAGAWRKVSPPPPAPPRAASSTSRTPRPPSLARRHRPVTLALRAALAACRCPGLRAGQGACARRAARPRAAPARRGARGGPAGARGAGLRGPPPWCSCAGPATWPPLRGGRGARPPPTAVRAPG